MAPPVSSSGTEYVAPTASARAGPPGDVVGVDVGVDDVLDRHAVLGGELDVGVGEPGWVDDDAAVSGNADDVGQAGLGGTLDLPAAEPLGQAGQLARDEQLRPRLRATLQVAGGLAPLGQHVDDQLAAVAVGADEHCVVRQCLRQLVDGVERSPDRQVLGVDRVGTLDLPVGELVGVPHVEHERHVAVLDLGEELGRGHGTGHGDLPGGEALPRRSRVPLYMRKR